MKIVVAGATGFIGRPLVHSLRHDGHDVVVLTRHPRKASELFPDGVRSVEWTGAEVEDSWANELEGAGGVVNLAGASIGTRRWTKRRKAVIVGSRVASTAALVAAIARLSPEQRPRVFVNASGIDYYGDRGDEIVTEESSSGQTFLASVCIEWESAALAAERLGVRVVTMRTPLVVSRDAVAFRLLALPFRLFVGGPLGDGRQWFAWVHLADAVGLFRLALVDERVRGALNVVAPDLRPQKEVARMIGNALRRPSRVRIPRAPLRLVLGDQADLLLHGQRAEPRKARAAGYSYRYGDLDDALAEALR